eukprot:6519110-Heterocapsa_arctica.AAC.1
MELVAGLWTLSQFIIVSRTSVPSQILWVGAVVFISPAFPFAMAFCGSGLAAWSLRLTWAYKPVGA